MLVLFSGAVKAQVFGPPYKIDNGYGFSTAQGAANDWVGKNEIDPRDATYTEISNWGNTVFGSGYPTAMSAANLDTVQNGCYGCSMGAWSWEWNNDKGKYAYKIERINWPTPYVRGYFWVYPNYSGTPFVLEPGCSFSTEIYPIVTADGVAGKVAGPCGTRFIRAAKPDKNLGCSEEGCGNPINVATGNKYQIETDVSGARLLNFTRYYNSSPGARTHLLGTHWTNTFSRSVEYSAGESGNPATAVVYRPDGKGFVYTLVGTVWTPSAEVTAKLRSTTDASGSINGWVYEEVDARQAEEFDALGRLSLIVGTDGSALSVVYNSGLLEGNADDFLVTSVTSQDGRKLTFGYDTSRRLIALTDAGGSVITYGYDGVGRLATVTYPGSATRTYVYNEQANTGGTDLPNALTGIVDEMAQRFATFKYGSDGRAVSTEHGSGVEKYVATYGAGGVTSIVLPLGATQQRTYQTINGVPKRTASTTVSGSVSRTSTSTYDAAGLPDVTTDALSTSTDNDYNARGLLTQRIESANKAATRRTSQFDWDPVFRLPTEQRVYDASGAKVSQTDYYYNSYGQIAYLARVDPNTSNARTMSFEYCDALPGTLPPDGCPYSGLLSQVIPPSGVVPTRYSYYMDSACSGGTCSHRVGDLRKIMTGSDVTEILSYDDTGRPKRLRDANGVATELEYTSRGWLSDRKVRGADDNSETDDAITHVDYWPTGNVKKVTQPDGAYTSFIYDSARRLTEVTDSLGNRIQFAPDNMGNRTAEELREPGGAVKWSLSRVYNALGELAISKDAFLAPTNFAYDANGALDTTTDPLGRISDQTLDPLGRLTKLIANTAGGTSDKATTNFEYNALDKLTAVVDPKGLRTEYAYNGFGEVVQQSSPDTLVSTYSYDIDGNRTSMTDARGILSTFTYDGLRRLTSQTVPTTAQNVYFDFDTPFADCLSGETFGIGHLARIRDESGSTRLCYDRRGNVVRKVQTVTAGSTMTIGSTFNAAGRLEAITYPSGAIVSYLRNSEGQIKTVSAIPSPGQPQATLVSGVAYLPFGPLKSLTFGNGRVLSKAYDASYNIDQVSDSAASNPLSQDFGVDAVGRITSLTERTTATATAGRTYSYDGLDRLTGQKNGSQVVEGFTYDATGNRASKTLGNQTTTYSYPSTSHRLTSVGNTGRTYDAAGNTAVIGNGGQASGFVFDDRNRLRDYKLGNNVKASYRYNGRGERVLRIDSSTAANTRQYVYDAAGRLLGEYTTAGARIQEYVWLDDTLMAILSDHDASTYQYVETDHLGTPRAVIHPVKNTIVWRWNLNNTSFGDHAPIADPDANGLNYTLNLRYPGQVYDPSSGLNYNYFRDYDPATGRYIESDPIGLDGGISTYGYVDGNPLAEIDPSGLAPPGCGSGRCIAGLRHRNRPIEHVYPNVMDLIGQPRRDENGDGKYECAELGKVLFADQGIPPTYEWTPLRKIVPGMDIAQGTLVANFVGGKYPQSGHRHTALIGRPADAYDFYLVDQWDYDHARPGTGYNIGESRVSFMPGPNVPLPQDGTAYYTVGWPNR
jgi:RHS repeat-associated protein